MTTERSLKDPPITPPSPAARHPWRFALLVMLLLQVVLLACFGAARLFLPDVPLVALDLPILLINAIIAAVLLTKLRWWREAGFKPVADPRLLWLLVIPAALLIVPGAVLGVEFPPLGKALVLLLVTLMIAFQEEAIFRGVLLRAFLSTGTLYAVLASSGLFAVIHVNSLLVGRDPAFVAVQVIASFLGGIGIAALRLRLGSIWPLIALHTLSNFVQFSAAGGTEVADATSTLLVAKLILSSLIGVYGLWLLHTMGVRLWPVTPRGAAKA